MRKKHKEKLANGDVEEILKECPKCHKVKHLIYLELLKRALWVNV